MQGAGGIGGLLARTDTNSSTYYHADGNGNITALMDGNENIVARYLYHPFGKLLGQWGTLAAANEMRFSSKEWNANAGLYYYLYRFYDPNLQRWPNRDPLVDVGYLTIKNPKVLPKLLNYKSDEIMKGIGLSYYNRLLVGEGNNNYSFANNSPVDVIDPLGLLIIVVPCDSPHFRACSQECAAHGSFVIACTVFYYTGPCPPFIVKLIRVCWCW